MQDSSAGAPLVNSSQGVGAKMSAMKTAGLSNAPWDLLAMKRVVIRTVIWPRQGYGGS
jgi:hypothetical protein